MVVALEVALLAHPGRTATAEALGEAAVSEVAAGGSWGSPSKTSPPQSILGSDGEEAAGGGQRGVSVPPLPVLLLSAPRTQGRLRLLPVPATQGLGTVAAVMNPALSWRGWFWFNTPNLVLV